MVVYKDLLPQFFRTLLLQRETNMLGLAHPKDHAAYKIGDTIVFREYFATEGPWGGVYGSNRTKRMVVDKIESAEDFVDPQTGKHIQQVRLFLKDNDENS